MSPYNPLDKSNLGASVVKALLESAPMPLGKLEPFQGAGIYAIYYAGDFAPYKSLAEKNKNGAFAQPIYVGKAVQRGARKGALSLQTKGGKELYKRLLEHAESLEAAENLHIEDFYCRFLVVDEIWIPLGETLLIAEFSPLWNVAVDGFGNHDPGKGRYKGLIPKWDILHPGRKWAYRCSARKETVEGIRKEIEAWLVRGQNFPQAVKK